MQDAFSSSESTLSSNKSAFLKIISTCFKLFKELFTVRNLLILLFVYTATSKLIDIFEFKSALSKSPVLSPYVNELAYLIPSIEILVSGLLFFDKSKLIGYYFSLLLLSSFTGYIIYIMNTQDHLPCTCGGVISTLSWSQHLIFNVAFILITIKAIYNTHKKKRIDNQSFALKH